MSRKPLIVVGLVIGLVSAPIFAQQMRPEDMGQTHRSATVGQQTAPQETGPRTGDKVSFCGPVVSLVEIGCIGVVGQNQTVELTAITPKPVTGKIIAGTGTISNQPNVCMQGLHLSTATWKEVTSC